MKIVVLTAMHARHELNKIFAMAMVRLKKEFDIDTVSVITHNDNINAEICKENGILYTFSKNKPVSNKFNVGLEACRHLEWDYVMILGSDDIPSNSMINLHYLGDGHDFIAVSDMWFWGLNYKRGGFDQFFYWRSGSSRIGAGRTISRRVVEALDYKLWPDGYNYGLDSQSAKRIKSSVKDFSSYSYHQKQLGGFLVDIKYELHISSLSPIMSRTKAAEGKEPTAFRISNSIIYDHLPKDECDALMALREQVIKDNTIISRIRKK